ncbi:hypothetical protein D9M68_952230 [compost metagenome]
MLVAKARRGVERLHGGRQFGIRMPGAVLRQEEILVIDEAVPAAERCRLVMAEVDPVRLRRQRLDSFGADLRCGV